MTPAQVGAWLIVRNRITGRAPAPRAEIGTAADLMALAGAHLG